VAIEILQPVQLQSNQAEMQIICSSGGGITASLSVNPPFYEGPCPPPSRPTVLGWTVTITDNVGNRDVIYRLIFSTGGTSGEGVIHFDQPGTQSETFYTTPVLGKGWGAIEILQPVQLQSERVDFEVICTPSVGGAPPASPTLQAENDTTTAGTTTDEDEEEDTTTDEAGAGGDTGGTDNAEPPPATPDNDAAGTGDTTGSDDGDGNGGSDDSTENTEPQ
jgi:hypothetical protein